MNTSVKIIRTEILSNSWGTLKKITFEALQRDGSWQIQTREAYDRGNGAVILLYNKRQRTVILTRQFRMPAYINNDNTGMLIEACAGLLDNEAPEDAIIRETQEETGYRITGIEKVFEAYMSPGSATEVLHFFIGEYSNEMKINEGGGLAHEHEDIEVLELNFNATLNMIETGEIKDAKTIILLQYLRLKNIL
jgi:nudix-type nucleoside diphosphatase (YffH/AdpP family)